MNVKYSKVYQCECYFVNSNVETMSHDQLNMCIVITRVINMATKQGSSRRLRSDVWNYFDKIENKIVTCKVCKQKLAYHDATTNLHVGMGDIGILILRLL